MTTASAFIIETADTAAGVVIRQDGGYRFFASSDVARSLDGRLFKSPAQAERAVRRLQQLERPVRPLMSA